MLKSRTTFSIGLIILFLVLLCSTLLSLAIGAKTNSLAQAYDRIPQAIDLILHGSHSTVSETTTTTGIDNATGADELTLIIAQLRIPRTLIALCVGASLAIAGALIQGHTRNPLADPGILGINAGAAIAVVICVYTGIATTTTGYVIPAMIGCAVAATAVFALSSTGSTAAHPLSIILSGVAISALLMAVVNALVLSSDSALDQLRNWSTGSVSGRTMSVLLPTLPFFIFGWGCALFQGRALNLLSLGESTAHSLGLPVQRYRSLGIIVVAILGGAATAAAGPIHFIGLAAPHIARGMVGPNYSRIIPLSGLIGACLALWADMLGRVIVRPGEMQLGIVMALVGVPFFILLIRRGRIDAL